MIIVSCPYCYKANYIVIGDRPREERLACSNCRRTFLLKLTRKGRSGKLDAELQRVAELAGG